MKFERPLEQKELYTLNSKLSLLKKKRKGQNKFLIIWTLLAILVGTIAYFKMDPQLRIVLYLTVAVYIAIGIWSVAEHRTKQKRQWESLSYLRNKNLVTVVKVQSDTFYELKEEADEGVYYLYQLGNNQILSFGGQDYEENYKFPNDHFEIVEGRDSKNAIVFLETYIYGKKIKPKRIISGKEKWDLLNSDSYPDPHKLTIANGRIEDYAK